jgi:dye decolorizing peroxidase
MAVTEPSRRALLLGAGVAGGGLIGTALGYATGATGPGPVPPDASPASGGTGGGPGTGPADVGTPRGTSTGTPGWAEPGGGAGRVAVSSPAGTDTVPFHGPRQAGIDTPAQAHAIFLALTLKPGTDRHGIQRMLRLLSDDAARLTQGRATLADTEPELAATPARMTVTFGFGPRMLQRTAPALAPSWLRPLPAFGIDRLQEAYSGGDLLLQLCGDDPMSLAHARRMLLKDARAFADVHWVQAGFRGARGTQPDGTTMRNLFGQVDGTANPAPGSEAAERIVWGGGGGPLRLTPWVPGGTSLVLRRIAMDLDSWDELDRPGKEQVIGRRLGSGAPLTGTAERDAPDLGAVNGLGFPVISDVAHLRRSRTANPDQSMLRRAYNYDDGPQESVSNAGLLFAAYQCDVDQQYVPIQRRLAESDHLNLWTTPVGSAVFAIPPGCDEDGFVGDVLFDRAAREWNP